MSDLIRRQDILDFIDNCLSHRDELDDAEKETLQALRMIFGRMCYFDLIKEAPKWTPVSGPEQLPKKPGLYIVTEHNSTDYAAAYTFNDTISSKDYWMRCVKAWMPMPKPYVEDTSKVYCSSMMDWCPYDKQRDCEDCEHNKKETKNGRP